MIRQWIEAAAADRGGAPYLEDAASPRVLTYSGLARTVRAWASRLDAAGVPAGARVALDGPDPLGYATALVGILGAGRVVVPLEAAAPPAERDRVLAVARPAAAVRVGFDEQSGDGLAADLEVLDVGPAADEPNGRGGIFLCTSGTTGTPKGILLDEAQLAHVAASVAEHHRLGAGDRGYCCLPLFHVNAEVVGLLATLAARACLVLDRKFSRRGFWPLIQARDITWINAVPAIISVLALDPDQAAAGAGERVRFVRSASAPLPPPALERFETAFGLPVVETYGMTEAASMIAANPLDGPRKPGSVGRPAGTEVRVARLGSRRYRACPPEVVGRVEIRGPGVIRAYASGGAGRIGPDGWLDTGDLGHFDADGYLFLAGRSDDVINRGGEKIYPRDIEDFLLTQPGVRSAVVIGVADEVLGQRVVAYVIPTDAVPFNEGAGAWESGSGVLGEALAEACAEGLPRAKRPSEFCLVNEMPVGPTGKVTRRRLREMAEREMAGVSS